jgi:photosystem II stability/assembly factor-like uncharacterized protein
MVLRPVIVAACAVTAVAGLALPAQAQSPANAAGSGAYPATTASSFVSWKITPTGSTDQFRGLAAVSADVAWVSGEHGTVLRTTDGGASWDDVSPAAAAGSALRDIEAFDADHAVTLAIGKGKHSKILVTDDGGATWTQAFMNHNANAFFDCMAFSNDGTGLAVSDPVNGRFRFVATQNGGHSWSLMTPRHMPHALATEFGFAASGTCLISGPQHQYWLVSGGNHPRVFHTFDSGAVWTVAKTPIRGGASAGIYSVAFRGANRGVVVGGDYADPANRVAAAATSTDGGRTWALSTRQVWGYRSGVAYVTGRIVVAVGPTGSDVSRSGGIRWSHFDDDWYDGIECAHDGTCWGSGTNGRVAILQR